jgi:formate dehydrogenase iron-sulfur subunit
MSIKIYIPRETTASSLGAVQQLKAIATQDQKRNRYIQVYRNGSPGAFSLGPRRVVETAAGRVGYGPVTLEEIPDLFDSDFLNGGTHAKSLGDVNALPWFANQERLTFAAAASLMPPVWKSMPASAVLSA